MMYPVRGAKVRVPAACLGCPDVRVIKVTDALLFKIIHGTGAFSSASAKLPRNRRFRSNYPGRAHPA
jgi:hypothetical protein